MKAQPGIYAQLALQARLVVCILLLSCGARPPTAPARAPQLPRAASVELLLADAQVWAFRTHVFGRTHGALQSCVIEGKARSYQARLEHDQLSADIELSSGANELTAACRDRAGAIVRSQHHGAHLHAARRAHGAGHGQLRERPAQPRREREHTE